ncbi:MAG TPA: prepilin peptidase [Bryobacteraceae bacterium]|nr:prepilin peptidase [Bryobacteraceae bacterium]
MIEAWLAALAGLLIGSFLNVCIYRLPRDLSVVTPRSFCPECDRPIAWYDNIPVLSYILLRARCRRCGVRIPLRYPLVEVLTAAAFFAAVLILGLNGLAIKYCVFSTIIIALVFSDFEERILPDEFTIGGTIVGLVLAAMAPTDGGIWRFILMSVRNPRVLSVIDAAVAAAFSSFALWAVGALYEKLRHREGLGFGDVKMVAMIGAFLGLQGVLMTLVVGSVLGSVVGIGFIIFARKDASTYELPFGTFLGIAAFGVAYYSILMGH